MFTYMCESSEGGGRQRRVIVDDALWSYIHFVIVDDALWSYIHFAPTIVISQSLDVAIVSRSDSHPITYIGSAVILISCQTPCSKSPVKPP